MDETSEGILVDTSVWIEFFKARSETGDKVEALLVEDSIWTCGVVLFELLQGVRSEDEKSRVLETLSNLRYAEMSKPLWKKAAESSASLRKKGINVPLSDILISIISNEHKLAIFTLDNHFKQIPKTRLYEP